MNEFCFCIEYAEQRTLDPIDQMQIISLVPPDVAKPTESTSDG